ncbi:apiosidase-like domain-containing protein [Cohnella herbarum]|uniref:DUF4038 domain-containing protein n=1 Tax=Cohnella herbarum TaxID=2728023 RepID=A0A7Z2VGP6_9BACL|nr:DUF4038 domain-containing protein [Cohnella herbarum]QJD82871.1 DUF4038 domain-containing protein [Cohnella herbarum]
MMRKWKMAAMIVAWLLALGLWTGANAPEGLAKKPIAIVKTEQWRAAEITLTSTKSYSDPFKDVDISATFIGPDRTIITRPGYWDGGNTWKVRFAPTKPGTWTYRVTASVPSDKGLHNQTGQVLSTKYKGDLAIYKHGFLKAGDSGKYLSYADGTPFFYLGDTHWILPHERFSTSNAPGVASQFKYMVDKRKDQGFTVYQSEPIWQPHGGTHTGADEEKTANLSDGFTAADLDGFRNLDRKFKYIADKGFVHANAQVTWALDPVQYPIFTEDYMARIAKYWVARFGAYPVIWTIAQEIDKNMYGNYNEQTMGKWYAVGQSLADNDSYKQPIMPHMEGANSTLPASSSWASKPYHDGWAVQWQGNLSGMRVAKEFWNASPSKPAVLYESGYDEFWTDSRGALSAAYKAFQYGMYGYGYGAAGVWNDIYSQSGKPDDFGTASEMPDRYFWWYDGANLQTADQLTDFKRFYTSLDWWKLVPRFNDGAWASFKDTTRSLLSSDGNNAYVVFFYNSDTASGTLKQLDNSAKYEANWFDPRTGLYYLIPETIQATSSSWCIPAKPNKDDWVLLLEKQRKGKMNDKNKKNAILDSAIQLAIADSLLAEPRCSVQPGEQGEVPVPSLTWKFDEKTGNTSTESSGGGSPAQLKGGADIVSGGVFGNSLSLDGVDDYAEIDSRALDGKDQFTISMWVNMSRLPKLNYSLIGKEGGDTDNAFRLTIEPSGAGHFVMSTSGAGWYSTVAGFHMPLKTGQWHQVTATYDGKNARVYIDGEEEGMSGDMAGGLSVVSNPIRLGYKSASNIEFAQVRIDELQLYDRALTGDQVSKLYSSR